MEKYGVDTSKSSGEKTAGADGRCPVCGSDLDPNSPTPKCVIHGTAPFEKKEEK